MNNTVISVEHLTKQYDLGVIGTGSLARDLNRWWARIRGKQDPYSIIGYESRFTDRNASILALDDISFQVSQGEALGIIGANGAGKSTLLKILSRVTAPTSGVVKVRGRIGSLLEVGTGFHGELTGRENVYLNGAILGMRKEEVERKFDEIVDFSGVEKFIDTPVKRYSSGMYVRLAFAVAAHLDPDILIVDEVLAVGDADFQRKCLRKMGFVAEEGKTVLFVSHNMLTMKRLCPHVLWLEDGKIKEMGDTAQIAEKYLASGLIYGSGVYTYEDGRDFPIYFTQVELVNEAGHHATSFRSGEPIKFKITYVVREDLFRSSITLMIMDGTGDHLWETRDVDHFEDLFERRDPGTYCIECVAPADVLRPGTYRLQLGSGAPGRKFHRPVDQVVFEVNENGYWKPSHQYFGITGGPIIVPMKVQYPERVED